MSELITPMDIWDWQLELAGREHVPQRAGWMLTLNKQQGGMASFRTNEVQTDATAMTATGIISTPRLDQSRDVVMGLGIDTSIHRNNPLVLVMHQPTNPCGRAEDEYGSYTVRTGDDKTVATTHFFKSLEGEQTFRLVEMKALPGMSVGIRPKPKMARQKSDNSGQTFCVIEGCWLVEFSHVFFPDNPDCLIVAVQKGLGGKPLVPSLKEMFMTMLPETKPIVNGATLEVTPEQWLNDLKQKSAPTPIEATILKASAKVQECVAHKIPILKREHPDWKDDQVQAAAYSICGEKKKGADHPEPDAEPDNDEDDRPLGAQYMAAHHEMLLAMQEFADENEKRLEPEVAKELEDLHEHRARMMDYVSEKYSKRYPGLKALLAKMEEEEDDDDEEGKKEKAIILDYKQKAREYVQKFWQDRQKKLKTTDHEAVLEAARFLVELASGPMTLTRTVKAAAQHHAKILKGIKESIAVQEDPEALQLEALARKLEERNKMIKAE